MTILFALSTTNKIALSLVAAAWIIVSLVVSMVIPRSRPDFPGRSLNAWLAIFVVFFAGMLATVVVFAKEAHSGAGEAQPEQTNTGVTTTTSTAPATGGGSANLAAGKAAWDKASCGGCHVLKAAGGTGSVGPDLDQLKPDAAIVAHQVEVGGGAMPAFKGILTPQQIHDLAAYVAAEAGK